MRALIRRLYKLLPALWLALWLPGCIIGTWPTPEDQPVAFAFNERGKGATGNEACNAVDDDGDGSIDEGCPCDAVARGCVGVVGEQCGLGVQWCERGVWKECADVGPPLTPKRLVRMAILGVDPSPISRDSTGGVTVVVEPTPACDTIVVAEVAITLEATTPAMRVLGRARDDGSGADAVAGDGQYTVSLANPFGPGVGAQTLTVRAAADIDGRRTEATGSVGLVTP